MQNRLILILILLAQFLNVMHWKEKQSTADWLQLFAVTLEGEKGKQEVWVEET